MPTDASRIAVARFGLRVDSLTSTFYECVFVCVRVCVCSFVHVLPCSRCRFGTASGSATTGARLDDGGESSRL
jgi:hypothetical protein